MQGFILGAKRNDCMISSWPLFNTTNVEKTKTEETPAAM